MNNTILDVSRLEQELNLLDGHMLGDGCLVNAKVNRKSIKHRFVQSCVKKDYLVWLTQNTYFLNNQNVYYYQYLDKRTERYYERYWVQSKDILWFSRQRERWYPEGKKQLPQDVIIDSKSLLRFYLDDGTVATRNGLYLGTDNFSEMDVNRLRNKMIAYLNIPIYLHWAGAKNRSQIRIYIPKDYRKDFLSIIGGCPIESFQYKWHENE